MLGPTASHLALVVSSMAKRRALMSMLAVVSLAVIFDGVFATTDNGTLTHASPDATQDETMLPTQLRHYYYY